MRKKKLKKTKRRFRQLLNYNQRRKIKRYPLNFLIRLSLVKSGIFKDKVWARQIKLSRFISKKPLEWSKFKQHLDLLRRTPFLFKYELHVSQKNFLP